MLLEERKRAQASRSPGVCTSAFCTDHASVSFLVRLTEREKQSPSMAPAAWGPSQVRKHPGELSELKALQFLPKEASGFGGSLSPGRQ